MTRRFKLAWALAATAVLSACIIVPHPVIPEEDDFSRKHLAFIEIGVTSQAAIEEAFGEPPLQRREGQLAIYAQARTVGGYIVASMHYADLGPIESYSSLIIQYDNDDTVSRVDVLRQKDACTDDGLCIEAEFAHPDYEGFLYAGYLSALSNAIVFTSGDEDAAAKQFRAIPERCVFYLYNTGLVTIVKAYTDSGGTARLHNRGYLYVTTPPGDFTLNVGSRGATAAKKIRCVAGEVLFVNAKVRESGSFWSSKQDERKVAIELVDFETGSKVVEKRIYIIN